MSNLDLSKVDLCSFTTVDGGTLEGCETEVVAVSHDVGVLDAAIVAVVAIAIIGLLVIVARKFKLLQRIKNNRKSILGYLSAWAIWCFAVFSYERLYGVYLDFSFWFTLPPLLAISVVIWYRCFANGKRL